MDRAFKCVDAHGAVMVVAQKEPFLTDADPTSHQIRLWRGGSAFTASNTLRLVLRPFLSWWRTVACLSLLTTIPRRFMAPFRKVGQGQGCLVLFFKGVFDGHLRAGFVSVKTDGKQPHSFNVGIVWATAVACSQPKILMIQTTVKACCG